MSANLRAPHFLKIERLSHRVCMEMEAPGDGLLFMLMSMFMLMLMTTMSLQNTTVT